MILRPYQLALPGVPDAVEAGDISVLELQSNVSWSHLLHLLRGLLGQEFPGLPSGGSESSVHDELFELADAVAQIIEAPITIEDPRSRVLAYSLHYEDLDPARISTIIGRRVPKKVVEYFKSRGVYRKLANSDAALYVPEGPDGIRPRPIIPIRVGGKWVGSVWAIVSGPHALRRVQELRSAMRLLALQLLRIQAQGQITMRMNVKRVRHLLENGSGDFGVSDEKWRVVGFQRRRGAGLTADPADETQTEADLAALNALLRDAGWREPMLADVDGSVFGVVTAISSEGARVNPPPGSWPWVEQVGQREPTKSWFDIAASAEVAKASDLPLGLAQVRELLRLDFPVPENLTNTYENRWNDIVISRATQALGSQSSWQGVISDISTYDAANGTQYVETLHAYLLHNLDINNAALMLHIHPNTMRYRLRKMREIFALDLSDPKERLALVLQLESALTPQPKGSHDNS